MREPSDSRKAPLRWAVWRNTISGPGNPICAISGAEGTINAAPTKLHSATPRRPIDPFRARPTHVEGRQSEEQVGHAHRQLKRPRELPPRRLKRRPDGGDAKGRESTQASAAVLRRSPCPVRRGSLVDTAKYSAKIKPGTRGVHKPGSSS